MSGISLASLEWMVQRYSAQMPFPTTGDGAILEKFIYVTLFALTHVWDCFFPLTCAMFFYIYSSDARAERVAGVVSGQQQQQQQQKETGGSPSTILDVMTLYLMVVFLEGGFVFGSSCIGLVVELLVGVSLSLVPFACIVVIIPTVCYLLVLFFDWLRDCGEAIEESGNTAQEYSYVAMV
eukprot:CAMPEP_0117026494 /NCGR_PEP_ID=MMETSP0472-20121206/19472_1 /TAXON_ID=693140 ORGANISM="Tiarina fusus, Strain LIS" /NCGR_SAMPLE_ID=MMETSP0472 /ASSEMBLY_ACC=CAM_ASM_000603 /LENGTH=179 /DNA_ID=CAMNT_0004733515 /DNA_START=280 /DNA_END=819 /DNA_ORIENTATION=+